MSRKHFSEDEMFRLAFLYAEQDRDAFIQCYPAGSRDPAVVTARRLVAQMKAYRLARWGRTVRDSIDDMPTVSMEELKRRPTP